MKEDLKKIILHYGVDNQQRKLAEEVLELQNVITHHELKNSVSYEIPLTELIDTREHIAEEIADVLNLLSQFVIYYELNEDKIYEIAEYKIKRQLERIEHE